MTEYVLDASLLTDYLVAGTYTAEVVSLFEQLAGPVELWVPEFCRIECANVLWKRVRFDGMPVQTALHLVEQLNSLPLRVVPSAGLLSRALEIGVTESLAVYDAVYIALAEMLEFPLITGDKKQKAAGVATGITLKPVTNFSPSSP